MNVVFLCPHSRISGGVKVIFRLASGLRDMGVDVTVCVKKMNDKTLEWFGSTRPTFPVMEVPNPSYHTLPDAEIYINYGDGDPFMPLKRHAKQVLFLQGFSTNAPLEEKINLLHPYNGVIATSSWLVNIARSCGHQSIYKIPPGIDSIFKPMEVGKCATSVVGTLYHPSENKNFKLFINIIEKLVGSYKKRVLPVLLSAKTVSNITEFDKLDLQYSIRTNPPIWTLAPMYSYCNVWISPSINEGFGLTTIEAMACGCPVITVRNFGLDEYLVHGKNCFIMKDADHAASILNALLDNAIDVMPIIKQGKELAAMFTWETAVKSFLAALREISRS